MIVPKHDLTISPEGHVTIKNARLVEKLQGMEGGRLRADEGGTEIGVTVKHSF